MAKKLTKAQIAKNPTKAINSGQMKMRKQEVPFGGIGKAAAKVVGKVIGKKTTSNGVVRNAARGKTGDYVVSGRASKNMMPKAGKADADYRYGRDTELSRNIKIKDTKSPSGKTTYTGGTLQVISQNDRLLRPLTAAEAKANARGLKAANKPTKAGKVMKKTTSTKKMQDVPAGVSVRFAATNARLAKEAAKKKSK
jgi:hypothetical protein